MSYLQMIKPGNKGTASWLQNQKPKIETTYFENTSNMNFYERIDGLDSTITCTWSSNKMDKHLYNNKFIFCITEQTNHNYGEIFYEVPKWYGIKLWWVFGM